MKRMTTRILVPAAKLSRAINKPLTAVMSAAGFKNANREGVWIDAKKLPEIVQALCLDDEHSKALQQTIEVMVRHDSELLDVADAALVSARDLLLGAGDIPESTKGKIDDLLSAAIRAIKLDYSVLELHW